MVNSHVVGLPERPALWSLNSARFHMLLLLVSVTFTNGLVRGSIGPLIVCMMARAKQSTVDLSGTNQVKILWQDLLFKNIVFYAFLVQLRANERKLEMPMKKNVDGLLSEDLYGASLSIKQQSYIHSSYYCGGIFGVFVSYLLMRRLGTKRILCCGLLINALGSVAMPALAVTVPYYSIVFLRLIMGLGNGFIMPCSVAIIRKWFPSNEKNVVIIALFVGTYTGIAASLIITPLLSEVNIFGGWTIAVVLYGIVGVSTAIVWEKRAAGKPRHSSYVTATELDYLRGRRIRKATINRSDLQTPFKKIIFSPCVIAACSSCYTYSFIMSSTLAYLPLFNSHILRMSPISNGIVSSVQCITYAAGILIFYTLSVLLKRHGISTTATIKIFACMGICGLSLCFGALIITNITQVTLLTLIQGIGLGFLSIITLTCIVCTTTVAPQFTVFMFSYTEIYAHLAGVISPVVVELLFTRNTPMQWQILVCLLVLLILSGLNFLFFAHGRHETVVERHLRGLSLRRPGAFAEESSQEEPMRSLAPELETRGAVSTAFVEEEAMIPIRSEELPIDELESLTSDDEY